MSPLATQPTWLLMLLVFGAMLASLGILRLYQLVAHPEPEVVRKLFHLAGGLCGLTLPWLFTEITPVLILAIATTLLFIGMRAVPQMRDGLGRILGGVERQSVGEFCFVASFCLLFWLAEGDRLLYGVPLLVLAVADTFAALVGAEYGKSRVYSWKGHKSLEGGAAFFIAAFFCVHVPVLLFTDTPRLESLLIAVNLALMVMMAELAAWWGLDNIIIPLFSFALLHAFLPMEAWQLAEHLAFLLSLSLLVRFWRHRTTLADDALFGASLWGYLVWALTDWRWLLTPLLLVATYSALTARTPIDHRRAFHFPVVLANGGASLLWLVLYLASDDPRFFYPFNAAFAINLTLIALVRHRYSEPRGSWHGAILWSVGKGSLLLLPGILAMDGAGAAILIHLAACTATLPLAAILFIRLQPNMERYPVDTPRWLRQSGISAGVSVIALLPFWVSF